MRQLLCILFIAGLASCKTTYRLTEQEMIFNPYHVGDTLIFKSNTGDRDTRWKMVHTTKRTEIFLLGQYEKRT